jgi:hypothetical protein
MAGGAFLRRKRIPELPLTVKRRFSSSLLRDRDGARKSRSPGSLAPTSGLWTAESRLARVGPTTPKRATTSLAASVDHTDQAAWSLGSRRSRPSSVRLVFRGSSSGMGSSGGGIGSPTLLADPHPSSTRRVYEQALVGSLLGGHRPSKADAVGVIPVGRAHPKSLADLHPRSTQFNLATAQHIRKPRQKKWGRPP